MQQALILIVDDDLSIRRAAADILELDGFRIAQAINVADGIAQLRELKPDLVLCDVMMPDGNGYDVLDALQLTDRPTTPFIFMSGEAILPEDIRRGMRSGADDYLIKPFRVQDLRESVQARLERQHQMQETLRIFKPGPALPAFLSGTEQILLEQLSMSPPPFLMALRIDQHERFQHIFGREGAQILCYSVFQRLKDLPVCNNLDFYASEEGYQIYLVPQKSEHHDPEVKIQKALSDAIQLAFAMPFPFERYQLHLQASQGWVFQDDILPLTPLQWLDRANIALYQSHVQGGGQAIVYEHQLQQELHDRLHWEDELQLALKENRFELYYQPQFELKTGRVVSCEALLRMHHPEFGMIPPGVFIPVAEESGLIVPIGTWVLQRACQTMKSLNQQGFGSLRMAVNVSILQFKAPDFLSLVCQSLSETGVPGHLLELELTESLLVQNFRQVSELLKELKKTGLTLAVDDFGTGYSSLFYINQLPFDVLKIDQSFVRTLSASMPFSQAIPRAIVEMGHGMGMKVLAEGIETEEQMHLLQELGCDFGQGFYVARPMPESELLSLLQAQAE